MTAEELSLITPVNFVQIQYECKHLDPAISLKEKKKSHLLPDTSSLCDENPFSSVAMAWNKEGLLFHIEVLQPVQRVMYPDLTRGDSVELFIDTRDIKSSGFNTKFCHHFFFLPEKVGGVSCGEITRFRAEETHELCDPKDLDLHHHLGKNQYSLEIGIPANCLFGFDPQHFERIGFTYRINRPDGSSQHFSVVSEDYQLEQQPSLWSSVKLV